MNKKQFHNFLQFQAILIAKHIKDSAKKGDYRSASLLKIEWVKDNAKDFRQKYLKNYSLMNKNIKITKECKIDDTGYIDQWGEAFIIKEVFETDIEKVKVFFEIELRKIYKEKSIIIGGVYYTSNHYSCDFYYI